MLVRNAFIIVATMAAILIWVEWSSDSVSSVPSSTPAVVEDSATQLITDKGSSEPPNSELVVKESVSPSPSTHKPTAEQAASKPPSESQSQPAQEDPYRVSPFSKRKLDLPKPKSIAELMAKLTPHAQPKLPETIPGRPSNFDGDVLTKFQGYYESADGKLGRIQLQRSSSETVSIQIEEADGSYHEWSLNGKATDLKLNNFADDPYSLVVTFPDDRLLYLKFKTRTPVDGVKSPMRTMHGWLLPSDRSASKTSRVAVVDEFVLRSLNGASVEQLDWVPTDTIKKLLPETLPGGN